MSTSLFLLRLDFLREAEAYDRMRLLVPLSRRLRAERYRFMEDRMRCLGAGLLLRFATGFDDDDTDFGPNGKPFFPAHPEICFSLSHSGDLVVCAVSQRTVGADVEEIKPVRESNLFIARRYFTKEEQDELALTKPDPEKTAFDPSVFTKIWTRKEAYVKMTGEGIQALQAADQVPCVYPEIPEPEGYRLSICLAGREPAETVFREVTPEELFGTLQGENNK